jgi:hypothetical protein
MHTLAKATITPEARIEEKIDNWPDELLEYRGKPHQDDES